MSAINTSLSGMQGAVEQMNVSAHNTANINTDGFKKLNTTLQEGKQGGVIVSISESEEQGPLYQVVGNEPVEASNVDYVEEVVGQIGAETMLKANIEAFKTEDEMTESLLDIKA